MAANERAAVNYGLAKHPFVATEATDCANYQRLLDRAELYWAQKGLHVERLAIPRDDGVATGLLIPPNGAGAAAPAPIVLGTNGIDVFHGEFFSFAERLAESGVAFFAFDIVGAGLHAQWPLTPDADDALTLFFLDALSERAEIDGDRIGLIGVSFGGNAALELAFTAEDRIDAVANVCGPIHDVFMADADQVAQVEAMYLDAIRDRIGEPDAGPERLANWARGFSLKAAGVIAPGARTAAPILSVNARNDDIATEADMRLVTDASVGGEMWFSGADDHYPQDRVTAMPAIADWLVARL